MSIFNLIADISQWPEALHCKPLPAGIASILHIFGSDVTPGSDVINHRPTATSLCNNPQIPGSDVINRRLTATCNNPQIYGSDVINPIAFITKISFA